MAKTLQESRAMLLIQQKCKIKGSSEIWSDKDLSKLSSLTKGHTEKMRGQRIIKKSNGSHGGTVGA